MIEPSPLCLEILNGPDQGRLLPLDQRTYRLGADLVIAGARGTVDLTVGASRVDVDWPGQSEVWLPGEVQNLGGVRVRLSQRADVFQADVETGLPPLVVFMAQLDEVLQLATGHRGISLHLLVIQLRQLPELRAAFGPANVGLELGKLAQRLGDVEGVTHRGRLTDSEFVVVCARPTRGYDSVRDDLARACSAGVLDFQPRITGRTFQPHASLFSALALESCRLDLVDSPRVHRPLPEHH